MPMVASAATVRRKERLVIMFLPFVLKYMNFLDYSLVVA